MTGVLFFDGACGMCTRSRDFLVRHDRTGNLETEPLQGAGVAERLGVPDDRLLEAMRWLDSSGAVYTGAEAWAAAWSVALGTRLPLLFYRIPGIRFVQNVDLPLGCRPSLPLPRQDALLRIASRRLLIQGISLCARPIS